jgi:hypothetical protein
VKQHLLLGGACTLNEALNQRRKRQPGQQQGCGKRLEYPLRGHLHHLSIAEVNDRFAGGADSPVISKNTAGRDRRQKRWAMTRERGGGYPSRQSNPLATWLRC